MGRVSTSPGSTGAPRPDATAGTDALRDRVVSVVEEAGAAAVGVCGVEPLDEARAVIEQRKADGLHGAMAFTYRNPARSCDPTSALPSARTAVVVAVAYPSAREPAPVPPAGPRPAAGAVARYAATGAYDLLHEVLAAGAEALRSAGWRAVVVFDDNALVDRAIAHRAGIGWLGKSANLLVPGAGSYVVLGTVLTDAPLADAGPAPEPVADQCGTCRRCLDGCPTGAIVGPGVLDASRCLSWLLQAEGDFPAEHREALGDRLYGCDECQEVCPPNRRAPEVERAPGGTGDRVGLEWVLTAADEDLMARLGAWYVPRRDPRYLRRNALVVLGNVGDPSDPAVVALLRRWACSGDEMLSSHAAWAAGRLGIQRGD
jgi:epoxyqueuosine reductase